MDIEIAALSSKYQVDTAIRMLGKLDDPKAIGPLMDKLSTSGWCCYDKALESLDKLKHYMDSYTKIKYFALKHPYWTSLGIVIIVVLSAGLLALVYFIAMLFYRLIGYKIIKMSYHYALKMLYPAKLDYIKEGHT